MNMPKTHADEKLLSLDDILGSDDLETKDVPVPEWRRPDGTIGTVRIKTLTNDELVEYGEEIEGDGRKYANLLLVLKCAIKADGSPLFSRKQAEQLQTKSAKSFNRIARACLDLNGVRPSEPARAKND